MTHNNYGPNYCDKSGSFITADDAANPKYIPHISIALKDILKFTDIEEQKTTISLKNMLGEGELNGD